MIATFTKKDLGKAGSVVFHRIKGARAAESHSGGSLIASLNTPSFFHTFS